MLLLIEVMDTSADLGADTLEMYRRPTTAGYSDARVLRHGERVGPQAFADLTLIVDELLG